MDNIDYASNSHKSKEASIEQATERPKANRVVSGRVIARKHNENSLKNIFISKDISTVKDYVIYDLIVPTIKKIIVGSLDIALNGDRGSSYRYGSDKITYRDYASISSGRTYSDRRVSDEPNYYCNDFIIPDRGEAERALAQLDDIMETYHFVTVSDLCETVGVSSKYTDNDYGWTDIRDAKIVRTRDGYLINMPKAHPLPKVR